MKTPHQNLIVLCLLLLATIAHAVDFHYLTTGGLFNIDGQIIASDSADHGGGQGAFADITQRRE